MSQPGNIQDSKAYRLLVEEATKLCQTAAPALTAAVRPPGTEEIRQLGIAFHRIRGGAGFFGLTDLAHAAQELETLLLKQEGPLADRIRLVQEAYLKFDRFVTELPVPRVG